MAEFRLLRGEICFVDDQDLSLVEKFIWHKHSLGYAIRSIKHLETRKTIWMHRLIAGTPDGSITDHIDGNKLNNTRSNLRIVTTLQNSANRKKETKRITSSIFKGVCFIRANKKWNVDHWNAMIKHKDIAKSQISLGSYKTEIEAAKAYNKAAKELFGNYANLNTF